MAAECPADHTLGVFVVGELPPDEATSVSGHVRVCPRCATRVQVLECGALPTEVVLRGAAQVPPVPPSDPEFAAAVAQLLSTPPVGPGHRVGDVIDDYRLVELIGEGGMGVVFRAIHTRLEKEVALKLIRGARTVDPQAVDRFRREMRAAGKFKLHHPNLVQATDAGVTNSVQYLVMDYVPGTNLARVVAGEGPLPIARACELVRQAALGLHHAHQHGLVHRDVKPSNLLLGADGLVRVLDLGLARLPDEVPPESPHSGGDVAATSTGDDTLTGPGQQLGTRDYTAPEQLRDSHRVDQRADVYGLGCTLVYLLTGRSYQLGAPFPPQPATEVWVKLLAPDPDDRFPTALAAAEALAAYCAAAPAPVRRGWVVGALVVTFASAVGAVLVLNTPTPNGTAEPPVARAPAPADPPLAPEPLAREVAPPPRRAFPRGGLPMSAAEALDLQKRCAEILDGRVVVKNSLGMELALIPPGTFAMSPLYAVTVSKPYRMGTTEVTFGQFDQFAKATGYRTAAERRKIGARFRTWKPLKDFPFPQDPVHRLSPGWGNYTDDQPVGYVSWDDVDAFLAWLSEKEKRTYRLPTHAEWVWACRAGTSNGVYWDRGDGLFLNELPRFAWTRNSGADRPRPVGRLQPNAWGLYDTIGNVEELVHDYFAIGFMPAGTPTDPKGPPETDNRVTCGGSYAEALRLLPTSELTGTAGRNVVYSDQGFRVVMEP